MTGNGKVQSFIHEWEQLLRTRFSSGRTISLIPPFVLSYIQQISGMNT